jgi:Zn-finger in ubiquitin-hydrolases and other protein
MSDQCTHLDTIQGNGGPSPTAEGCVECLAMGGRWVHLRRCLECGHVGCCDSSPNRHATAHFHASAHPLIQSFEPGEEWVSCYVDDVMFLVDGFPDPSPSHP